MSPLERAAFLLHDVFDVPFDEVAARLDRAPSACPQLTQPDRTLLVVSPIDDTPAGGTLRIEWGTTGATVPFTIG